MGAIRELLWGVNKANGACRSRYFCCKRSSYERAINSGIAALCQFAQRLKPNLAGILARTGWPLGTNLVEGIKEKGPAVQGLQELGAGAN